MKTYDQSKFRKVLLKQLDHVPSKVKKAKTLKRDNCDLLVYLIYVNYMNELIKQSANSEIGAGEEGEITQYRLDKSHEDLMKKYRG